MRSILHPLWDLRFSVGHQIRQMDDFAELEIDNPEFLLALLDARAVAGDRGCSNGSPRASHRRRLTREFSTR